MNIDADSDVRTIDHESLLRNVYILAFIEVCEKLGYLIKSDAVELVRVELDLQKAKA